MDQTPTGDDHLDWSSAIYGEDGEFSRQAKSMSTMPEVDHAADHIALKRYVEESFQSLRTPIKVV